MLRGPHPQRGVVCEVAISLGVTDVLAEVLDASREVVRLAPADLRRALAVDPVLVQPLGAGLSRVHDRSAARWRAASAVAACSGPPHRATPGPWTAGAAWTAA